MSDFFDSDIGHARNYMRLPALAQALDVAADAALALDPRIRRVRRAATALPRQRVLVVGVEVPGRGGALHRIADQLARSRHDVVVSTVKMQPKGKFENVQDAIAAAPEPLARFDWLIVTDDDVGLPAGFTDRYLAVADLAGLTVSQPAHRFLSYASYGLTRRQPGRIVRATRFVEIGPLTVIRRDGFDAFVPFPPTRWAWGLDILWSAICRERGWVMGIVDAVPIRHLKPVGATYNKDEAVTEARELLARYKVTLSRAELMDTGTEAFPR